MYITLCHSLEHVTILGVNAPLDRQGANGTTVSHHTGGIDHDRKSTKILVGTLGNDRGSC